MHCVVQAELYDKMARGEMDDDEETYNVDFFQKGGSLDDERESMQRERRQQQQFHYAGTVSYREHDDGMNLMLHMVLVDFTANSPHF